MLKIRRLNMDSSWQISWNGHSILFDPWLIGSEIDGFSWFNEQWHATSPAPISSLETYDAILISQHFSDHCHEETVVKLKEKPVYTTKQGSKRIGKVIDKKRIQIIPELNSEKWLKSGDLEIALLSAPFKLSATFNGIVLKYGSDILVYCPHGYNLTDAQKELLNRYQTVLLITSFSSFKLPFFLGGMVNPGVKKAKELVEILNPNKIIATHDEDKHAVGLVKKIAKVNYPSSSDLELIFQEKYLNLDQSYQNIEISV